MINLDLGEAVRRIVNHLQTYFAAQSPTRLTILYPGDPDPEVVNSDTTPWVRMTTLTTNAQIRNRDATNHDTADFELTFICVCPVGQAQESIARLPSLMSEILKAIGGETVVDTATNPTVMVDFKTARTATSGEPDEQRNIMVGEIVLAGTMTRVAGTSVTAYDG